MGFARTLDTRSLITAFIAQQVSQGLQSHSLNHHVLISGFLLRLASHIFMGTTFLEAK